jgi:ribokinase
LKTPKPSVVVVGSSNTDMIIKLEHLPQPGETLLGGKFATACGGKGANQAVAAARAGGDVTFVGKIGRDAFGEMAMECLVSHEICTDYVFRDLSEPSGVAMIFVAGSGQNSIAVAPGANAKLNVADIKKARLAIGNARVLLAQLETPLPTIQEAIELATAADVRVILNPAPAQALPASLLKRLFLTTPNEHEAELLTGVSIESEQAASAAAQILLRRGVQNVIITMGSRGAFVASRELSKFIPSHKVKAVDATGAGDIFNGALAVAIAEGQSLVDATEFANAAAAIGVTRLGAQSSVPNRKDIESLLQTGKLPRFSVPGDGRLSSNGGNGLNGFSRQLTRRSGKKLSSV